MNQVEEELNQAIDVVPPEPMRTPVAFKSGKRLYLEEGAELPVETCFCCGRKAVKTVSKSLRSPINPMTWIGKKRKVTLGLCRKHGDNKAIALALTWSVFGLGVILLGVGAATVSLSSILIGTLAVFLCGVFRASLPVRSPDPSAEPIEVRGFSLKYLDAVEVEWEPEGE